MPASVPMPSLPRLTDPSVPPAVRRWADALAAAVETQIRLMNAAGGGGVWTATTSAKVRNLNAGTATATQTAEALATLVADLAAAGVIVG